MSNTDTRAITLEDARNLPGLLGRIAPAMLANKGEYTYQDKAAGRTVRLVLGTVIRSGDRYDSIARADGSIEMVKKERN